MGGGGNPIESALEDIKNVTKSAESAVKVASAIYNPAAAAAKGVTQAFGGKGDFVFDPIGTTAAEAGEAFVDKPKAAKEEAKRIAGATAAAQRKMMSDIESRKKQEGAESEASEALLKARARQRRRSRTTGRESTILSQSLGGVGGDSGGRKGLLGL
jgi:hypothetical protein